MTRPRFGYRPGNVYRLYSRARFDAMNPHAISEIHRQPLDKICLDLMTLNSDLGAAEMLAETVEPPEVSAVERSFDALFTSGFVTSADPVDADITGMGAFVASLGVDLTLGHLVGIGAQMGTLAVSDVGSRRRRGYDLDHLDTAVAPTPRLRPWIAPTQAC